MHRCRTRLPNTSRARTWIQPSRRHLEVISGPSASHSSSLPLESFLLDAGTETKSCGKRDVHHGLASSVESCLSPDASERPKASELYEMLDGIDRPLPPDPAQAVAANAGSPMAGRSSERTAPRRRSRGSLDFYTYEGRLLRERSRGSPSSRRYQRTTGVSPHYRVVRSPINPRPPSRRWSPCARRAGASHTSADR